MKLFSKLVGHRRDDEKIVKTSPVAVRKDDSRQIRGEIRRDKRGKPVLVQDLLSTLKGN
jgi:hypothetical protein